MSERVRTTVAIKPEVLEVFRTMANAAGMSVSRCIGEWLDDTAEGAQMVARKMVEARQAPRTVMRELQAAAKGLQVEIDLAAEQVRAGTLKGARGPAGGGPARVAPASNTGRKSPRKGRGNP